MTGKKWLSVFVRSFFVRLQSLPPDNLFLLAHSIAIEIQGSSHYVGHDFQTRNGSTLLKIALLQKAGINVLEIPGNQFQNSDSVKTYKSMALT